MENNLYRIEVLMSQNLPEIDTCGMLMTNEGIAYVKLHPVRIKATPKTQKEAKLYWKPVAPGTWDLTCSACDSHLGCSEKAKFCPECGAMFIKPEALAPELPEEEDDGNL